MAAEGEREESGISVQAYVVCLVVGGALLALWVDERVPRLRPATLPVAVFRALVALVATEAMVPGEQAVASVVGHAAGSLLVTLPGFLLLFLAGIWVIRAIQRFAFP